MRKKQKKKEPVPLKAIEAMQIVANEFSISVEDMLSKIRKRTFVDARHMAMLLIYEHIYRKSKPMMAVSSWFNCDHTTLIHGIEKIRNLIQVDSNIRATYYDLETITESMVEDIKQAKLTIDDRINRLPSHDKTAILSYLEKVEKLRGIV